jgi:GFO/IDH/MocA oxidoreductase family protein
VKAGHWPRVAIVGVRRVRTGLGPFFAKHLAAAGAEVPAFIASRRETIEEGRWALRNAGIDAPGFTSLDELLAAHPTVNAIVIASPHETHRRWLDEAIGRGLHVLCEKPLVWGDPSPAWETARLIELAAQRGVALFENCPWPYALPAFDALHPKAREGGVRTIEMEMAPSSSDPRQMVVDAMSHPLSVLQALAPGHPRTRGVSPIRVLSWDEAREGRVEGAFVFQRPDEGPAIDLRVRLRTSPRQPRPMAIVVNGCCADRTIRMDDYAMSFADGDRQVPLPDPLAALVAEFVRAVDQGEAPAVRQRRVDTIAERMGMLTEIVGTFPGA